MLTKADSLSLEQQLTLDEGKKLEIYKDTEGYWTVGIGHLIQRSLISRDKAIQILDRHLGRSTSGSITDSECTRLFNEDIYEVRKGIQQSAFCETYKRLDDVRQSAIENMCFQLGVNGVGQFKNMWKALALNNYNDAYKHGRDSRWYKQTPNRAERVLTTLKTGSTQHYRGK
ncbi:glycoside hydrolase family protein [Aeromonas caviae]